jgi:hypothetical protein
VKSSARGVLNRIKVLKGGLMVAKLNKQGLSGHQLSWPWFIDEVSRITHTAIIAGEGVCPLSDMANSSSRRLTRDLGNQAKVDRLSPT